ncbi:adenylyl cyclase [Dactylosporangium vinaceum]|uniref:Adenylyl cyclase n=1 Tax=Dactylosporangium vinaceum TaxID=53362 RepID=A0ABV5M7A6_9ACTN|nr:adenylyl cyclase [Dactylosporangium vinaceum]UAB95311.1 adenylyl cyclase [Dactylosporangium vinaceum]
MSFGSARPSRRGRWFALGAAVLLTAVAAVSAPGAAAAAPAGSKNPDFGPNVKIFDPSMTVEQIKSVADSVLAQQIDNEMGTQRYTLLFKPGTYGTPDHPLQIQVGYYTEVAGLGLNPTDTVINGHVDVYNRCLAADNCIALVNFWRSLSNLTINVAGLDGCRASGEFWAVSQAAPLRRVKFNGNATFMDYCTAGPQYASGGFMADSVTSTLTNGSQQQFLVRDSNIGTWSNAVWNQVFSGTVGAPAQSFPNPQYTTLDKTPASKEKPFLYVDAKGKWNVFEPALRRDASGASWANGPTPGRSIPLSDFYLAKPSDSVLAINIQLALGKHLLFTPGVYNVNSSILVWRPDTVVLGMGIATLTAVGGSVPLWIADSKGISVSGLMIDAGTVNSPALMQVGTKLGGALNLGDANDPTVLHDVFFRVGGPHVGKADVSLEVNSDHVILDDIWAWRADHGVAGSVGWDINTGRNGVIVNGDDVLATGLFVEHYQQYNVVWNGERGKTIFFQNELPYDPPNQAAWSHDGVKGWAAYKVADKVKTHELWGGGSYIFTNVDPTIHAARGFEVPNRPGVKLHDILTVNLSAGTIDHVVNDTGAPVATETGVGVPSYVTSYPAS